MISVTFLSGYEYCKRKLFLEQVLKFIEIPKDVLLKGSIRHRTHELINKSDEPLIRSITKKPDIIDLEKSFKFEYLKFLRSSILKRKDELARFKILPGELFKRFRPFIEYEAELRTHKIYDFITSTNLLGDELWDHFYPKIRSELRIESPRLQLKGIIDQLEVYPDSYVPIELKTGTAPKEGVWPGHKIQLGAYALLVEDHFNTHVEEGFIHYLDHQKNIHIHINPFLRDEVKDLTKSTIDLLNQSVLPEFCSNKNKCKVCGLREICYNGSKVNSRLKDIFN